MIEERFQRHQDEVLGVKLEQHQEGFLPLGLGCGGKKVLQGDREWGDREWGAEARLASRGGHPLRGVADIQRGEVLLEREVEERQLGFIIRDSPLEKQSTAGGYEPKKVSNFLL